MARRSRSKGTKGASGSGKTKRPQTATPAQVQEIEALLDEAYEAVMARDSERALQVIDRLSALTPVVPDVITRRLIEGREQGPGIALTILTQVAPDRYPTYLQRIVTAFQAPDMVRYDAHRLLGWDPWREHTQRLGFLNKLQDPYGTLAASVGIAGSTWPERVEIVNDVNAFLRALQPPGRYEALDRIIAEAGWNAIPLLHGLIHDEDAEIQRRSIEALASYRYVASLAPLRRLERTAQTDDIRQQVADVLANVIFDQTSAPGESDEAMFPASDLTPLVWARVTRVDPDGNQALWIARRISDGFSEAINFYVTGESGLSEVSQYDVIPDEELDEEVIAIEGEIAPWTTIDLSVARGLLDYAIDLYAQQTEDHLPFLLEIYAPMLHDSYPPSPDEPVVVPILDATPFAGRADLVARGTELFEHPLFNEWAFQSNSFIDSLATGSAEGTDDEFTGSLAERLLNDRTRVILADALRRQAWLLEANGSNDERDIALALAAWIPDASNAELIDSTFVKKLMETTLSVAFGMLGAYGMIDDFDDEDDDWLDDDWSDDVGIFGPIEASWRPAADAGETAGDSDSPER